MVFYVISICPAADTVFVRDGACELVNRGETVFRHCFFGRGNF